MNSRGLCSYIGTLDIHIQVAVLASLSVCTVECTVECMGPGLTFKLSARYIVGRNVA